MWNYSDLAKTYDKRPKYSDDAISFLLKETKAETICDVGAGTGILTSQLLSNSQVKEICPVEPNEEMSKIGIKKTKLKWTKATAEETTLCSGKFDLVTYGSSFNVCSQKDALKEARRILKDNGYVCCLWNHRQLDDTLQNEIEEIIKNNIPNYEYGIRRKDQTEVLVENNWKVQYNEFDFKFEFEKNNFMEAMNSHCTLKKQSGSKFEKILKEISNIIPNKFLVPYKTVMWIAK